MNPRSNWQKVAAGVISAVGGKDKFHFSVIPNTWFKIDVKETFAPHVPLMWEVADVEQRKIGDVVGGNAVWDQKYLKLPIP
jgi:hypothetical protein